jgi:glyoxylase-like metal-dependent hydrolase (beta-lactamase superfamily II)
MIVIMNTGGVAQTNSFLIADESTKQAVVFDAPDHTVTPLLDEAQKRGLDVVGLWLTHGHFDHVAEHHLVKQRYPASKLLIHPIDEPKLQRAQMQTQLFGLPFVIQERSADAYVEDGQMLKLGNLDVEVIHTPGHAPGHVMYYLPKEKVLVGGDLIIGGAVGRTDLPDSDHNALIQSVRRVMKLPGQTKLLPGHGDVTTLDDERATNPYVRSMIGVDR